MTILERYSLDSPWLFRTKPLDTNETEAIGKAEHEMSLPTLALPVTNHKQNVGHPHPEPSQHLHSQKHLSYIQATATYPQQQQRFQPIENVRHLSANGVLPADRKKVLKSSTVPNLAMNHSFADMFRVI